MTKLPIQRKRVIVVGGSFAGLALVRHLSPPSGPSLSIPGLYHQSTPNEALDVVIIEPKDYFEYAPGSLHLLTGSKAYNASLTPMKVAAGNATHIQGRFQGFRSKSVDGKVVHSAVIKKVSSESSLGYEEELDFDALVLCNGRPYSSPIRPSTGLDQSSQTAAATISQRISEIELCSSTLQLACEIGHGQGVVVIGGGLVGVEFMGEIVHRIVSKKPKSSISPCRLVLISRGKLLNTLPIAAGNYARKWLTNRGVEVWDDDEIVQNVPSTESRVKLLTSKKGKTVEAMAVIDCTGSSRPTANTRLDLEYPYTDEGYVQVDENLRCSKYSDTAIFAAGDVVEHMAPVGFAYSSSKSYFGQSFSKPLLRNAHTAESQAEVVAENIRRILLSNSSADRVLISNTLASYPKTAFQSPLSPLLACVSLGPNHGIIVFNNLVLGGLAFYLLGGLIKFVIERSKISEIRNESWGRLFWAFGHVITNFIHRWMIRFHFLTQFLGRIGNIFPFRPKPIPKTI